MRHCLLLFPGGRDPKIPKVSPKAPSLLDCQASHLGKVNLLEQRWDPLEWHLGLGTGLTLTIGSFIGGCAASEPED